MVRKVLLIVVVISVLLAGCSGGSSGEYSSESTIDGETTASDKMTVLDKKGDNITGSLKVIHDSYTNEFCYVFVGTASDGIDCIPADELNSPSRTPRDESLTVVGKQTFGAEEIEVVYDQDRGVYCHLYIGSVGDDPSCNPASNNTSTTQKPTTTEGY